MKSRISLKTRRIIKCGLCPVLFRLRIYNRLLNKHHRDKVVILAGHRVSGDDLCKDGIVTLAFETGITKVYFAKLIRFLREEMHPVSLEDVVNFVTGKAGIPDRAVALTLDDGYMDNYLHAFPILKRYQVPATIFPTTGFINGDSIFWWDRLAEVLKRTRITKLELYKIRDLLNGTGESLPDVIHLNSVHRRNAAWRILTTTLRHCDADQVRKAIEFMESRLEVESDAYRHLHSVLTWDQIREMSQNGIGFGAHTVTHAFLGGISPHDFRREVVESKKALEKQIEKPVVSFAYPYGVLPDPKSVVKGDLRRYGFHCAFLFGQEYVARASDPFELMRIGIKNVPVGSVVQELTAVIRQGGK